jgi:hypothetical protein
LRKQPAIDERREQIRMGLSLDEDPVVEQVVTCLQASHLNSEYSRLAGPRECRNAKILSKPDFPVAGRSNAPAAMKGLRRVLSPA